MVDDDRYFDREAECRPRSEILADQEARLVELVAYAHEHAPLYQKVWSDAGVHPRDIRSLDDFRERVPFISKDTIRWFRDTYRDPFGGLLCLDPSELTAINSTSGTTGDPTLVPEYWAGGRGPGLARDFWMTGVRPGDHMVIPMFTFRGPIYNAAHGVGAVPIVADHSVAELPRLCDLIRQYRPTGWYTISGPLLFGFAELEAETGIDLVDVFSSFRGAIFAGEPLGVRARANVERWGLELFEHSSAGDVGAAFECDRHDGMHVWEDVGFYECIDPAATDPASAAEVADAAIGELVASNLDNRVMPLLRYRSDDLDRLSRERCACGRTHARLWTLGRKGDEVVVDGRSVLPRDVWEGVEAVDECAAGLFQIVRTSREVERLRLRVGHRGATPAPGLADRVADSVLEHTGVRPEVLLVPNDELLALGPPHKIPRVARQ